MKNKLLILINLSDVIYLVIINNSIRNRAGSMSSQITYNVRADIIMYNERVNIPIYAELFNERADIIMYNERVNIPTYAELFNERVDRIIFAELFNENFDNFYDDVFNEDTNLNAAVNDNENIDLNINENKPKKRILNPDQEQNIACPIGLENIQTNDKYMQCSNCKYNFNFNNIKAWISNKQNKTCPNCRNKWDSSTVYINK